MVDTATYFEINAPKRGEPWFDDGNIMLVTSESPTLFRLHRGVLARHSEVFQDMFEVPQPMTEPLFDGCQVVTMHDIPVELSNLIKALYDGVKFYNRNLEDFFHLAGILRLSTKYFIDHLRIKAIRHLAKTWSYTLQGHDQMVTLALKSPSVDNLSYPYVHPLHVLNLVRETNVRIVVPSALYFLSLYPLEDLLRGDHPKLVVDHPSRPSSSLSVTDIKDYTLMFQRRIDIILDFVRRICGDRPTPTCATAKACARGFARLAGRLSRSWMIRTGPIHYMLQALHELSEDPTVCEACRRSFRQDVLSFREEKWKELPSILGLPNWEELEASEIPS